MGSLPQGSRNAHINQSYGPDTNVMKFYVTENSTKYGKQWENFKPRTTRHTGTGYLSNFRPGVYYSQRLDEVDNPAMGNIVAKNYHTVTQRDFLPYQENSGNEIFPGHVHQTGTGFIRDNNVVKHTKIGAVSPIDALPSYKPLLHRLKGKDPVEMENHGYGPKYMVSETQEKYKGRRNPDDNRRFKTIGTQETTGFTNGYGVEPITYNPSSAYKKDGSEFYTTRPTGTSIMKTDYLPSRYPFGDEKLPHISNEAEKGSGFTREKAKPLYVHRVMGHAYDHADDMPNLRAEKIKKSDPAEYLNTIHPNNHTSVNSDIFKGAKNPELDKLNRTAVGPRERSGFSGNNEPLVTIADDRQRFVTHYMTRFLDENPQGIGREGHCRGGAQLQKADGFTKSTSVHANDPRVEHVPLRDIEPYVSRSIKARDPFYTNDLHSTLITAE
ncbi:hypothetical protein LOTGIDRAFT_204303 [Lottia gigantea]|uniref:Uncharacterized protein n=1 Tax=Lottia gigantea TaxID=225164 RepID=V4BLT5_LOTGI|nr:hypothetical protein LOTGIDRAFT_204303 [Lottia gigantea]ESO89754.1 hypothetical protein LOTGIDRAFT_204303 [Lottia gigantea]